ncbi:hypothetical protein C8Q74DRAFT_255430 [Fomes fomentarius]|nr:hypothetical protein C8Q74DRAFT_255430 [Fomes fomentarius]
MYPVGSPSNALHGHGLISNSPKAVFGRYYKAFLNSGVYKPSTFDPPTHSSPTLLVSLLLASLTLFFDINPHLTPLSNMLSNKFITLSGFVVLVCSCVQASPIFLPIGQRDTESQGPASQRGSDGGNGLTGGFDHMAAPQMFRYRPSKPTPSSWVLLMTRSSDIPTSTFDYSRLSTVSPLSVPSLEFSSPAGSSRTTRDDRGDSKNDGGDEDEDGTSLPARGHDSPSSRAATDGPSDDGDDGLSREDDVLPFSSVVVGDKTIVIPSPTFTPAFTPTFTSSDTVTATPTHGSDRSNGGYDEGDPYGGYDGGDPYDGYPQYSDEPYTRRQERKAALTSIAIGSETIFLPSPTIVITSSESTPTPTNGSDGSNRYEDYPPFYGPGEDGYDPDDGSSGETTSASR